MRAKTATTKRMATQKRKNDCEAPPYCQSATLTLCMFLLLGLSLVGCDQATLRNCGIKLHHLLLVALVIFHRERLGVHC